VVENIVRESAETKLLRQAKSSHVLLAVKMFISSLEPLNIPKAKNIFATNLVRQFGEIQFYI